MTLDQQIADILDAFRRELSLRLNERASLLASDITRAATAAQEQAGRAREDALAQARAKFATELDEALVTARADALRDRAAAIAAAVEAARVETERASERLLVESRARERQSELACFERVLDGIRRFDQARTLTDVLDTLGEVVSREAPRVALFLVRGGRLSGWRASGFPPGFDPRSVDVPNESSSLLWQAVARGEAVGTALSASGERLLSPFGELPDDAAGLAVPVRVGGEPVAVIYADDAAEGPRETPSAWPEVIELVSRHAARCLEVVTLSRAAAAPGPVPAHQTRPMATPERPPVISRAEDDESARRYARLLVSEIKLYHEAAVTQGRQDHNLADRLQGEIARARRLYEERVPADIRGRVDYFHQELVRTLANGDPALLGSDRS